MVKLKQFGFFDSEPLANAVQRIRQQQQKDPAKDEQRIMRYLEAGHTFLLSAGVAQDLLDPQRGIIGVPNVLTDGQWAWTEDVLYYVREYHIRLPEDFVRHMAENNWTCPKIADPSSLELDSVVMPWKSEHKRN
jgi:hypothetical protein